MPGMNQPLPRPGRAYPLGAHWDGHGVNFALFSGVAQAVELCLFDAAGVEQARVPLPQRENGVWHGYLDGVGPGQRYAYRVHGPWDPAQGLRCNPHKLVLDPYARAIEGDVTAAPVAYDYSPDDPALPDPRDNASALPKCVVVDPSFDWGDAAPPRVPWNRTVIYEAHVKGLTMLHPHVEPALRGTYLGLASPAVIEHLQSLGVTALELLPVQHHATEPHLLEKGLTNHWGYSTIGFFAPDSRYASSRDGGQVREFQTMVQRLHAAGIEVILDVVYNHTAEGGPQGPTYAFRGIDNQVYYHLAPDDPAAYVDFTGCGNTFAASHPRGLQLILDSLRYWVEVMHVDGFRFDLAPALGRNGGGQVEPAVFAAIQQDPTLAHVKLIAEPWDLGHGGYMVGHFPPGWAEWNGKYRDTVRRFWRGEAEQRGQLGYRLSGSSDLYGGDRPRSPSASINFVTCHDGFTLKDLVSYERKHNEANGEQNRDGCNDNWGRNWGAEGATQDPLVLSLRRRAQRNLLATLVFSQGVPMLNMGDELGRSQGGNNNAYCQDNPISWVDWSLTPEQQDLLAFTQRLLAIRAAQPVLRRRAHFTGAPLGDDEGKDLSWLRPDGQELGEDDWKHADRRALGMLMHGKATCEVDDAGAPLVGDTLLLLLNASPHGVGFTLPAGAWETLVCTAGPAERLQPRGDHVDVPPRSLILLRSPGAATQERA